MECDFRPLDGGRVSKLASNFVTILKGPDENRRWRYKYIRVVYSQLYSKLVDLATLCGMVRIRLLEMVNSCNPNHC